VSSNDITIRYFAWMREHTGTSSEVIALPEGVTNVEELVPFVTKQSAGHATALADMMAVRVAVNRTYGDLGTAISSGDEIAFFPPVTGG